MAQIFKIRQPNGDVVTPADWTGAEPLWSTVEFAEGPLQPLIAFSYGKGGAEVPGSIGPRSANESDTNLEGEGNRLPENEELICYNIACEVFAIGTGGDGVDDAIGQSDPPEVSALNMLRLQRDVVVSLRVASTNRRFIEAPIGYFPASTGVKHFAAGGRSALSSGVDSYVSANNGSHNAHDIRRLSSPVRVRGGETFGLDFMPGPGQIVGLNVNQTSGMEVQGRLRVRCFLDGYRRRPVA